MYWEQEGNDNLGVYILNLQIVLEKIKITRPLD